VSLTEALHSATRQHPALVGLVCDGQRLGYQQWAERSARLGAVLRGQGIAASDRVAVLAANSNDYMVALTGTWWIGAVACPVNTRWSLPEMADSLRDCGARTLFVDRQHAALVRDLRGQVPELRAVLCFGADAPQGTAALEPLLTAALRLDDSHASDEQLAALLYTGGTTGRAKGVMLSHRNLAASALARIAVTPDLIDSVALVAMPLFHVAGLVRLLTHLYAGGRSVIMPQFRVDTLIDLIDNEDITDLPLVPSMLQSLLDHPKFDPQRLRSLRRFSYGAAPIADALLERALGLLPNIRFSQAYGMTECAALATLGEHQPARSRSAGRACGTDLRIVDPQGLGLPADTIGEITVRGPNVMQGYWNRPQETAQALRAGWLHTGDAGYLDADGYLYVVDRIKDMIISGGENVYSVEVENVLLLHPAVQACAVFGLPSEQWGEAVHAVVVLRAAADADATALGLHCRSLLAGYKCPKQIRLVESLPMTPAGKVAKHLLRGN
jgi:long-chain acyl-CoA synthetase